MSDPIPMLPGRTLTNDTLLRLALYGLVCALKIDDPTALGWIKRVIRDAGIDTATFRENHEIDVNAARRKPVEMTDELRACGLI